jgi:hypothetical protein
MLSLSFIRLHRRFISSINIISPLPRFVSTTMSELPTPENPRIAALFDVDGTLTIPRGEVKDDMMETLKELRKKITVGMSVDPTFPNKRNNSEMALSMKWCGISVKTAWWRTTTASCWNPTRSPSIWEKTPSNGLSTGY